jgi:hypothetical protein
MQFPESLAVSKPIRSAFAFYCFRSPEVGDILQQEQKKR